MLQQFISDTRAIWILNYKIVKTINFLARTRDEHICTKEPDQQNPIIDVQVVKEQQIASGNPAENRLHRTLIYPAACQKLNVIWKSISNHDLTWDEEVR